MRAVAAFLHRSAEASVRAPRRTVAFWLAALALAGVAAVTGVEFRTSNLDLIDPALPPVRRFLDFAREFGTPNVLVVVLEGGEPAALEQAVGRVAERVRAQPGIRAVVERLPLPPDLLRDLGLDEYLRSRDRGMYFLFVQPADPGSAVRTLDPFVAGVRRAVEESGVTRAGVRVGYTGIPQYALDDRDVIRRDASVLSVGSFLLVFLIFRSCFPRPRRPAFAMAALLASVVVNGGLVALFPGHLTLLSASFASVSFGLGVDYGIHIITRLEERLAAGEAERAAIPLAVRDIAREVATGALTTAGVFLSLGFCGFRGFEELGVISAMGVLACMYGMVTLLPALLCLCPGAEAAGGSPRVNRIGGLVLRGQSRPVTAALALACAGLLATGGPGFDSDYLELQPADSETARLERELERRSDASPLFAAFTTATLAEAGSLSDRLLSLPGVVADVRSAADLEAAAPGENLLASLPAAFRASLVSPRGRHAVYAYPEGNAWEPAVQRRFVAAMQAIDPEVTGMPVLGLFLVERSREALRNSIRLGLPVLALLVWSNFRRPVPTLLALLPTLLGYGATMGLLRLLGIPLNPLNLMALPVVMGIAVDDGIHITGRFLEERGDLRAVLLGAGRSVFLTNATAVAGFACLAFTAHRGLASFAITLSLGVATAYVLSSFLLPSLLSACWRRGWLRPEPEARDAGVRARPAG